MSELSTSVMKCVNCNILMLFYAICVLNCPLRCLIPSLMLFCFGLQGAGTPGSGGGGRREGVQRWPTAGK